MTDKLRTMLRRELLTGEEVRALAGTSRKPIPRSTLIYWRKRSGFPSPVLVKGERVELWSRREVQAWLEEHAKRRRFIETGQLDPDAQD